MLISSEHMLHRFCAFSVTDALCATGPQEDALTVTDLDTAPRSLPKSLTIKFFHCQCRHNLENKDRFDLSCNAYYIWQTQNLLSVSTKFILGVYITRILPGAWGGTWGFRVSPVSRAKVIDFSCRSHFFASPISERLSESGFRHAFCILNLNCPSCFQVRLPYWWWILNRVLNYYVQPEFRKGNIEWYDPKTHIQFNLNVSVPIWQLEWAQRVLQMSVKADLNPLRGATIRTL